LYDVVLVTIACGRPIYSRPAPIKRDGSTRIDTFKACHLKLMSIHEKAPEIRPVIATGNAVRCDDLIILLVDNGAFLFAR
jgi:hypothetical protein